MLKKISLVQITVFRRVLIRHSRAGGNPEGQLKNLDSCFRRNNDRVDNLPYAAQIGQRITGNLIMKKAKPLAKGQQIQEATSNFPFNLDSTEKK